MLLEICAFNIQSCFVAQASGAGRIEFCSDPLQGGVTPSFGAIEYALEHLTIPVFPMIRPRGGDFIYDVAEMEIMKRDILKCKELGCIGIATGSQNPNKELNIEQLKWLVEWAYPMQVTCHKVFDMVADPFQSLEELISAGVSRVLTSGTKKTALEGASILAGLVNQANGRITIMPGGGVRSSNLGQLVTHTQATEFHSSGILSRATEFIANEDEVRALVSILK